MNKKELKAIKKAYFNTVDSMSPRKFDEMTLTDHINAFYKEIKNRL